MEGGDEDPQVRFNTVRSRARKIGAIPVSKENFGKQKLVCSYKILPFDEFVALHVIKGNSTYINDLLIVGGPTVVVSPFSDWMMMNDLYDEKITLEVILDKL